MSLHQPISNLIQVLDLLPKGGKVTLQPLMLPLQALDSGQVMAKVLNVQGLVFLINPVLGFISISVGKTCTFIS